MLARSQKLTYRPSQRNHLQMPSFESSRQRRVGGRERGGIGVVRAIGLERETGRCLAFWISLEAFVDACPEPCFVCPRVSPSCFEVVIEIGGGAETFFFESLITRLRR